MKISKKLTSFLLTLVMVVSTIAVQTVPVQATKDNKVLATKVKFIDYPDGGDNSSVSLRNMVIKDNVTFGKSYGLNMKIYVPEEYMEKGDIAINPSINVFTGKNNQKYLGWAGSKNLYSFKKNSKSVTQKNGFYIINVKMKLNTFRMGTVEIPFPKGSGELSGGVFVVGDRAYEGNIYFDDVELLVNNKVIATANYSNGKAGACTYSVNGNYKHQIKAKVVSLPKENLTVENKSISIREGETKAIKAKVTPKAKITYKSSNTKVATVTGIGIVKGVHKGKATITVKTKASTIKVKVVVQQAPANKVLETNVDFRKNPEGDNNKLNMYFLIQNKNVTFGKSYSLNMKMYVPEELMNDGSFTVYPQVRFWTGNDLETDAGWGDNKEGISFDKSSKNVTKQNKYYVIPVEMPITNYYDDQGQKISAPKGKGQVVVNVEIKGNGDYKGSIYFDDVTLVSDQKVIASEDYNSSIENFCFYYINGNTNQEFVPKICTLPEK